jgi:uncharacterized protein
MVFHPGELEVQKRVGVTDAANEVGEGISDSIAPGARMFIGREPLAVVASVGPGGAIWASAIGGEPGFMEAVSDRLLKINSLPSIADPLHQNLQHQSHVAVIILDLEAARRLRLNGVGWIEEDAIYVQTAQVYANCPRYIQHRHLLGTRLWSAPEQAARTTGLSPEQRGLINRADTFFIATDHPQSGADISHKGGNPGFVTAVSERRVAFPDYNGNRMFNTLGNITVGPAAGLLFVDFASGRTLQLSGRAGIDWNPQRAASVPGAERMVDLELREVIDNPQGFPLRYQLVGYSRYNPD